LVDEQNKYGDNLILELCIPKGEWIQPQDTAICHKNSSFYTSKCRKR